MNPKSNYRKEMVLALFLLLGVNSSWRWFGNNDKNANLAARNSHLGMVQLASETPDNAANGDNNSAEPTQDENTSIPHVSTKRTGIKGAYDVLVGKSVAVPAEEVIVKSRTKNSDQSQVKTQASVPRSSKTVSASTSESDPRPKNKVTEKVAGTEDDGSIILHFGDKDTQGHKVYFDPIRGAGRNYTTATVTATEAGICDANCGRYQIEGLVDPSSAESLENFSNQLIKEFTAKDVKESSAVAKSSTPSSAIGDSQKVVSDDDAGEAHSDVPPAVVPSAPKESEKKTSTPPVVAAKTKSVVEQNESEDISDEQVKIDAILKKCDSSIISDKNRVYLRCLVNSMTAFNKTEKDKELKATIFEEIYSDQIKERLEKMTRSDDSNDNKSARDFVIKLQKLFPEKTSSNIRNEMRSLIVKSESKKLQSELLEDVNSPAKKAALAYAEYQNALKSHDYAAATNRQRDYQAALNQLYALKLNTDVDSIRNEPIWDSISGLYNNESLGEVDQLLRGIYTDADKYRDGLFDNLSQGRSIEGLLSKDQLQLGIATPTNINNSNTGIMPSNSGMQNNAGRSARNGAPNLFSTGGYPGADQGMSNRNSRGNQSYSPMDPTGNLNSSYLINGGSPNNGAVFYNGSVTPLPFNSNQSYPNNNSSSSYINYNNRPSNLSYNGNTNPSWNSGNFNQNIGSQYMQPNCQYSSMSPLNYNSSGCNSNQNTMYNGNAAPRGGRFGN